MSEALTRKPFAVQPEPLTHCDPDGNELIRTREVDDQIVEILSIERDLLLSRAKIRDYRATGYVKEESLVYIIRRSRIDGDEGLVRELLNVLVTRIATRIHNQVAKFLHEIYVEECCQEVLIKVSERIVDVRSDCDDFAQVRFGLWLTRVTQKLARPYISRQRRLRAEESATRPADRGGDLKELRDPGPLPDQMLIDAQRRKEAMRLLVMLDPELRAVFLMRHLDGWEIENQDPAVMTISRYFHRSPRTIRKWLKIAEEILRARQGDKQ